MFRKTNKNDILNGNILQQLMLFFFPVFLGYILQQVYSFADSIVLGRFVGKQALASVGGSATAMINIILNLVSGITAATTVIVAQNYGRGNYEKVVNSIKTGMYIAIVLGGIITIVMIILSPILLNIMNEPLEMRSTSLTYMYLYFGSMIFYFVYQTGVSILRALGDSKRPVYFILITAVVKIGFDLLLAGVFKLGVLGTSIATFLSHLVCAIVILFIFEHTSDVYQYSLKDFGYSKDELKAILSIGIPFSIQSMLFAIPTSFVQLKINGFGTDAIAAYSAYSAVDNIYWCFANSLGAATLTIASQNYGNNNIARVRRTAYYSALVAILGAGLYGFVFYTLGNKILSLFLTEPDVITISKQMLNITCTSYIINAFIDPVSSTCKAVGDAKSIMYIAVFTILVSRSIYLFMFPQPYPYSPIISYPISWILTSLAYIVYFFINKKLRINK